MRSYKGKYGRDFRVLPFIDTIHIATAKEDRDRLVAFLGDEGAEPGAPLLWKARYDGYTLVERAKSVIAELRSPTDRTGRFKPLYTQAESLDFLRRVLEAGFRVVRLDVAVDDTGRLVFAKSIGWFFEQDHTLLGSRVSKDGIDRRWAWYRSDEGDTIYIGKHGCSQLAIYQFKPTRSEPKPQTRIEHRFNDKDADQVAQRLVKDGYDFVLDRIREKCTLLTPPPRIATTYHRDVPRRYEQVLGFQFSDERNDDCVRKKETRSRRLPRARPGRRSPKPRKLEALESLIRDEIREFRRDEKIARRLANKRKNLVVVCPLTLERDRRLERMRKLIGGVRFGEPIES